MVSVEESIGKFSKTVAKFCNHLQSSGAALKESVDRRPIPLDSASTTFIQSVNRRVNAAGVDLNMLESMTFGTVSFEELLGHCNEVLKKNQSDLLALHDHLGSSSNYNPSLHLDEDFDVEDCDLDNFSTGSEDLGLKKSYLVEEDDPLFDDSLSLINFGISDVCLATIASQERIMDEPDFDPHMDSLEPIEGETRDNLSQGKIRLLKVSRDDYESLPKHMKGLASWEDLSTAVEKMNAYIGRKQQDSFRKEEIELLELGFKARSYLLLLIKMNRVNVETKIGVISYRVSQQ
ncbi:uncharacterized protein [Primulina huaijiensis]|uniref:uncharacterized protein n=1 Tax=Primulina huaijiensis TaxID=1492673 RepID=UPI003CC6E142